MQSICFIAVLRLAGNEAFQVTSKIDSRTILGEQGAEQLLGQGDMLHMAGGGKVTRVHGPFVSDEEVEDVVQHLPKEFFSFKHSVCSFIFPQGLVVVAQRNDEHN